MWKGLGIGACVGLFLGLIVEGIAASIGLGIVFGFIGWLIGLIVGASRGRKEPTPKLPASAQALATARPPAADRIAALEMRVSVLEARIARMASGEVVAESLVAQPPPIPEPESPPVVASAAAEKKIEKVIEEKFVRTIPVPIPKEPPKPNPIVAWFTGGNTIVRVGIVVLFIGLGFLVRYSVEHELIPPELRIAGVGFAGIVLLVLGWRLRTTRPGYALSLQGAGVGITYLTVFGALRLYSLIPPQAAFPLLVIIAAFATWLAVKQDAVILAAFGAVGGFIAPVIASTGHGDHVMLFGYFTVLNLAVLATAYFKSWRSLNLIGFAFTFGIALVWGDRSYKPEHFATVEPFLIIFFLMYVAIAVLFSRRQAANQAARVVDGTIVFGVPLVGFGLQAALVEHMDKGLALSALVLALFYLGLAYVLHRRGNPALKLLVQSFLALGIVFITVTIPLAFDPRWTAAAWAIEGAAVLWVGARQKRWLPQLFGSFVQLAAGGSFALAHDGIPRDLMFVNGAYMGFLLIAAAGLFSHLQLRKAYPDAKDGLGATQSSFFLWAMLWWIAGFVAELHHFFSHAVRLNLFIAFLAGTALVLAAFRGRGNWKEAAWPSNVLLPVLWLLFAFAAIDLSHPFWAGGWLAWPFAIVAHLVGRRLIEDPEAEPSRYASFHHSGVFVLVAVMGAIELRYGARISGLSHTAWSAAALIVVPCVLMLVASSRAMEQRWPVSDRMHAYRISGALPLVVGFFAWIIATNLMWHGSSAPLPYLPLLNAIDLGHALIAITMLTWWRALARAPGRPSSLEGQGGWVLLGVSAFAWANGVLLRSLHHWAGEPYQLESWMRSFLVQASLSIFWSLLALGMMVWATRKAHRAVWMVGAALMGVVVAKLALIDFSRLGGLERIVSFIGVGVLMLVIGYFSPLPPKQKETGA
ncbi:hypothetical protein BWI17_19315 [Betaproteobacteria bacterium GR16-43]|nr:hypothetical protein BWI17_19315 [Betaproteobacteria bacterium GR16-43]